MIKFIKEISSRILNMYDPDVEKKCEAIADTIIDACIHDDMSLYFVGIGKSHNLAESLSDSFKSIGIKSFAIDANTGLHGDSGVVRDNDIVFYLSRSGNTEEIIEFSKLLPTSSNEFLITNNKDNKISEFVQKTIVLPNELNNEFNIIPISTLIYTYTIGMLIFKLVIEGSKFTNKDFLKFHPKNTKQYIT